MLSLWNEVLDVIFWLAEGLIGLSALLFCIWIYRAIRGKRK